VEVNIGGYLPSREANQRARKALFTCVLYTNVNYCGVLENVTLKHLFNGARENPHRLYQNKNGLSWKLLKA